MSRITAGFYALIAAQAAHSIEEYAGRLWESFPPARFVSGLVASDRETGFLVINAALVGFGMWCALFPVRHESRFARRVIGFWVALEAINGLGHLGWSLRLGGYTPGVITAPILVAIGAYLVVELRRAERPTAPTARR